MRLVDLDPRWVGAGGEGITDRDGHPVPERHGVGVSFECPCGLDVGCDRTRVYLAFSNPLDGGAPVINQGQPTWDREGDDFESLTLRPSIARVGGCAWHGFLTSGELKAC
jgi:hypothetical protein